MEADFSGYATKAGLKCSDGRTITRDAFAHQDKVKVPLVWQHAHNEPTNVLDPRSAHALWTLLVEQSRSPAAVAVLATTHDLLWALRFADVLTVLAGGEVRFSGPPIDLLPADALAAAAEAFDELANGLP